jgi:predicted methyltransferase
MRKMLFLMAPLAAMAAVPAQIAAQGQTHDHASHSASASVPAGESAALAAVLADPRRAEDRSRDAWRHPSATLGFFRVKPGMTVVDYTPGSGWWTRILVPYLGDGGRYIGLNPDVSGNAQMQRFYANTSQTFPPKAAQWTGVPAERIAAYNTDGLPASLNGTVDRVLMFRAMHNLKRSGMLQRELPAIRALLKPDGLLGIEQHRAKADAPDAFVDGSKGYLREKDVIALVEGHGFELVGKSEINANPTDPANHAEGVWTLPPNLRGVSEADKPRYTAIGESDRMTLLFRKRA